MNRKRRSNSLTDRRRERGVGGLADLGLADAGRGGLVRVTAVGDGTLLAVVSRGDGSGVDRVVARGDYEGQDWSLAS